MTTVTAATASPLTPSDSTTINLTPPPPPPNHNLNPPTEPEAVLVPPFNVQQSGGSGGGGDPLFRTAMRFATMLRQYFVVTSTASAGGEPTLPLDFIITVPNNNNPTEPTAVVPPFHVQQSGDGGDPQRNEPLRTATWFATMLREYVAPLLQVVVAQLTSTASAGGDLVFQLATGSEPTLPLGFIIMVLSVFWYLVRPQSLSRAGVVAEAYTVGCGISFSLGLLHLLLSIYARCVDDPAPAVSSSSRLQRAFRNSVKRAGVLLVLLLPLAAGYFRLFVPAAATAAE